MITSETKLFSIISGVICGVALIALFGMLYFIYEKDAAYVENLKTRSLRGVRQTEVASLDRLLAETAHDREELAAHMLTEDTVVDFLSLIGSLARTNGVTAETRSLAVEPIEGNVVFEYLTLDVDATGSFEQVAQFLSLLESLPYQIEVRAITLERASEIKGDNLWIGTYKVYVTKYK